jgi:SAM-dependent methyltransferase
MSKWKYSEDKKSVIFEDNEMYVKSQDNTFRSADDPRNIKRNQEVIDCLINFGEGINKVVDIGCRECFTEDILKSMGIHCLGVDVSPKIVSHSRSKGRNVILGDAHSLSSDLKGEVFDAVISVHSLEHCYDVKKVLEEFKKALRKGGYVAIRIPIQEDITSQPLLVENAQHSDNGLPAHYSVFRPKSFSNLVENSGFKILHSESMKEGTRYEEFFIIGKKKD